MSVLDEAELVELLAPALLREYMHKKGYRATLAQFDEEEPRTPKTISSRSIMKQLLALSTSASSFTTFMEMLIDARIQLLKSQQCGMHVKDGDVPGISTAAVPEKKKKPHKTKVAKSDLLDLPQPKAEVQPAPQAIPNNIHELPTTETILPSTTDSSAVTPSEDLLMMVPCPAGQKLQRLPKVSAWASQDTPDLPVSQVEVLVEDFGDVEELTAGKPQPPSLPVCLPISSKGVTLGREISRQIKRLLLGDRPWRTSWITQGLYFNTAVPYGLIQDEGGPCGPLAVLQAYILKDLLFDHPRLPLSIHSSSKAHMMEALAAGMTSILFTIATRRDPDHPTVLLATLPTTHGLTSGCRIDDFIVSKFHTTVDVTTAILDRLPQYTAAKGNGLMLFLVSALLTKVGDAEDPDWTLLTRDMDCCTQPLIVEHGYSGLELVNLLLHGTAVSNMFDGVVELPGEGTDVMRLQGIQQKSAVGFLTLFEHYGSCTVGHNLKDPLYPLWVICSESHFSVLFTKSREDIVHDRFDLFYYDQLGMQDEEIRLTIDTTGDMAPTVSPHDELLPPLDLVIRTKWPKATVNWNETDPLL